MEVGAIEADGRPMEGAIEGAIAPRSKGDGSRSKGDRTLQIYRKAVAEVVAKVEAMRRNGRSVDAGQGAIGARPTSCSLKRRRPSRGSGILG